MAVLRGGTTLGTAAVAITTFGTDGYTRGRFVNIDGTNDADASAYLVHITGTATTTTRLINTVTIPADAALVAWAGEVVKSGDVLWANASAASDIDLYWGWSD